MLPLRVVLLPIGGSVDNSKIIVNHLNKEVKDGMCSAVDVRDAIKRYELAETQFIKGITVHLPLASFLWIVFCAVMFTASWSPVHPVTLTKVLIMLPLIPTIHLYGIIKGALDTRREHIERLANGGIRYTVQMSTMSRDDAERLSNDNRYALLLNLHENISDWNNLASSLQRVEKQIELGLMDPEQVESPLRAAANYRDNLMRRIAYAQSLMEEGKLGTQTQETLKFNVLDAFETQHDQLGKHTAELKKAMDELTAQLEVVALTKR